MRDKPVVWCMLAVLLLTLPAVGVAQDAEETFGCEANPTGNPIGGGEGYTDILTTGDFIVKTTDEFLAALKEAKAGQVVFLPGEADIDLTEHSSIEIPGGVTIASTRGLNGSLGGRLFTKNLRNSYTLMRTMGDHIRLTGLRIEGPYPDVPRIAPRPHFIGVGCYGFEIDNCEVSAFIAAISVGARAMDVQIHHNWIHHCQRAGLGYGIATSSSDTHIIANKLDYCRHHIASPGSPGTGYEAAWNLVGPEATSHNFDVHGGRDRGDNTVIAGDWFHIHHNTFQNPRRAIGIRGIPSQGAEIHHNWFTAPVEKTVLFVVAGGDNKVYRNVYGPDKTLEE